MFKRKNGYYLEQRWRFYSWDFTKSVYYCYPFFAFMIAIGIIQITFLHLDLAHWASNTLMGTFFLQCMDQRWDCESPPLHW